MIRDSFYIVPDGALLKGVLETYLGVELPITLTRIRYCGVAHISTPSSLQVRIAGSAAPNCIIVEFMCLSDPVQLTTATKGLWVNPQKRAATKTSMLTTEPALVSIFSAILGQKFSHNGHSTTPIPSSKQSKMI